MKREVQRCGREAEDAEVMDGEMRRCGREGGDGEVMEGKEKHLYTSPAAAYDAAGFLP